MPKRGHEVRVWVQQFKGRKNLMLQWFDPETGKRKSQSAETDDPEKAKIEAGVLQRQLEDGVHLSDSRMTWERFREIYETQELAELSENNATKARCVFNRFEKEMNPRQLAKISERTINGFKTKLFASGIKASTVKGYLAYIKVALRWAKQNKYLRDVPHIDMPKVDKGTNRARIRAAGRITAEEFERVVAACPNDGWRLLIQFAWYCGMRRMEARSIHGEHIDLERHTIRIPRNKAGDISATAPIPPELDAILRERYPRGIPNVELIDDVPSSPNQISKKFRPIAKRSKVRGNSSEGFISLHDMRRNFGSRWAPKVPAQILQRMMRHSSITVTMDYYADTEDAAINAMWAGVTPGVTPPKTTTAKRHQDSP